jgi:hypothetical protein
VSSTDGSPTYLLVAALERGVLSMYLRYSSPSSHRPQLAASIGLIMLPGRPHLLYPPTIV